MLYDPQLPERECLYYVMDPMCSWCWAFAPALGRLVERLPSTVDYRIVLGGLAPDSDEPMPAALRLQIQQVWRLIAERTGTRFNHDFWSNNVPRRSTYPACRAVLAAASQNDVLAGSMIQAIQRSYYLEAQNPSNQDVLLALAGSIGLNRDRFREDLNNPSILAALGDHLTFKERLGAHGFPTLVWVKEQRGVRVAEGYLPEKRLMDRAAAVGLVTSGRGV